MNTKISPLTFTKEEFIEFVKSKPPAENYKYSDITNCAVAQFLKTKTNVWVAVGGFSFDIGNEKEIPLPAFLLEKNDGDDSFMSKKHNPSQTFGALLTLLEAR